DPLATYGMGAAYIQLEEFAKAVPYLERATQVQKDYSAAYLNLGKCHEFLGNAEDARATYLKGIEAANRKGDLMPLREMERRLKGLDSAI
ncbi:MAG: tetratricopeptide repeat protein, partial [Candidatus Hydrogenedentes bacterium]|nr:tetratricopeptide repeat protein [Candidatus Hydrogenedentota bacterium]